MMRLLHFADIHLGAEIHGRREGGMHSQLKDFLRCLDFLVETGVEEGVDVVLFAGDAYHHPKPDPLPQREWLKRIVTLSEKGIPIVLVAGNHDLPLGYGEASPLDIFEVVKVPGVYFIRRPKALPVMTRKGPLTVLCLPYLPKRALVTIEEETGKEEGQVERLMEERLEREILMGLVEGANHRDGPVVFVGHVWVHGAELSGSERILHPATEPKVSPGVLRRFVGAYGALGHLHRHQEIGTMEPPLIYAGSLGRLDFSEEGEEKGFVLVDLEPSGKGEWGVRDIRFLSSPTRPFITVELDLTGERDPTQAALNALRADRRLDGAVVRVFLSLSETQREQINLAAIRSDLERRVDHLASLTPRVITGHISMATPPDDKELDEMLKASPLDLFKEWLEGVMGQKPALQGRKERLLRRARELMRKG